tara:strand:+ start:292 stop:1101 length:810 start_codon:yes stop_codon:yes gene_type:complete
VAKERLNVIAMRPNLLMWIPMHRKTETETSGIGWESATGVATIGQMQGDLVGSIRLGMGLMWREWNDSPETIAVTQGKAQCVDWAYKTPSVGLDSGDRVLFRGLAIRVLSHGAGKSGLGLFPTWATGLLNTLSAADLKEYSSQIVDFAGKAEDATDRFVLDAIERMIDQSTIQTRIANLSAGDQAMLYDLFNHALLVWGDPAVKATGNVLIGDEEVFEKRTSEFLKGSTISSMIFGHAQQTGVRLVFDSLRLLMRPQGKTGPLRRKRTS